jgi:hypothetical protein
MLAFRHDQRCHPVQDACKTLGPDTLGGAPEHGVKASQSFDYVSTITMACHSTSTLLAWSFGMGGSTALTVRRMACGEARYFHHVIEHSLLCLCIKRDGLSPFFLSTQVDNHFRFRSSDRLIHNRDSLVF